MGDLMQLGLILKVIESTQSIELFPPRKRNTLYVKCLLENSAKNPCDLEIYFEGQDRINELIQSYNTLVEIGNMSVFNLGYSLEKESCPIFGLFHSEETSQGGAKFSCVASLEREAFDKVEESLVSKKGILFKLNTRFTLDYYLDERIASFLPKKNVILAIETFSMHLNCDASINRLGTA